MSYTSHVSLIIQISLPEDFEVCKTSPIKSLIRNEGFGHSMITCYYLFRYSNIIYVKLMCTFDIKVLYIINIPIFYSKLSI